MLAVLILAYLMACAGVALIIDAWRRHRHRHVDLTPRVGLLQPSIADEAESWLEDQGVT